MYISFEKGMITGASYISNRYSKAKNKDIKPYDPTPPPPPKKKNQNIFYRHK